MTEGVIVVSAATGCQARGGARLAEGDRPGPDGPDRAAGDTRRKRSTCPAAAAAITRSTRWPWR